MPSGEDALIARLFAPLAGPGGLGLRDDVALLAPTPGHETVLTVDAVVEGVHFFDDDPPDGVGAKALGVNLSDLAAKGATPRGFLLALALPSGRAEAWLDSFAAGLGAAASAAGCPLLGGDTVSTPGPLMASITALGEVPAGRMVPRTGAKPGDLLYVTGTIGDAALGLQVRLTERGGPAPSWLAALPTFESAFLRERYWRPRPRLALRDALALANAAMDVSDGLVGDCAKMLRVSGVSGRLSAARVPCSPATAHALEIAPSLREAWLTGGDDYEVLAAVPPGCAAAFETAAAAAGIPVTAIGEVCAPLGPLRVEGPDGTEWRFARTAYSHV